MYKAVIFGVKGLELTDDERHFFRKEKPVGFALFSRNIDNKKQLKTLVADLRTTVGNTKAPILIDQEGGRVARLKKPHWYHPYSARIFGNIATKNIKDARLACKLSAQILATELLEMGINVDCAPVIDVPIKNANDVIGDRAFSYDINIIVELAEAMIKGLNSKGINHIIKHIPGHGRSLQDSHFELPVVDTELEILRKTDFIPFTKLNNARWAMTAHIVYKDIDAYNAATHSASVIKLIRDEMKFKGIIITDCLTMQALTEGPWLNTKKSFDAGCDLALFSKPDINDMQEVIEVTPVLTEKQSHLIYMNPPVSSKESVESLVEKLNLILENYGINPAALGADPTERHF